MNMNYDVVVVGAGASGIPAAIGAARAGAKTLLIEEDQQPGGACVDQYVAMINDTASNRGGVYGELQGTLLRDYKLHRGEIEKPWSIWFMPSDYLRVVMQMINAEPNLDLRCGIRDSRPIVEDVDGRPCVKGLVYSNAAGCETRISAGAVVDATGAAEFADLAGCRTLYGRDAKSDFDEELAVDEADEKVQLCTWQYISQSRQPGQCSNMPGVRARPLESGYGWLKETNSEGWARNSGLYLHWGCRVRCDDTRDRTAVARAQCEALDLMADDLQALRESGYTVHLAPKIGIRESRRLLGETVITANDLLGGKTPEDTVFVTERGIDIWTEGKKTMDYPAVKPYGIPFGALVPKNVSGLVVVGKAISGTHVAMSAYRTQGILGYVGEAGGVAAALCAQKRITPSALDSRLLRDTLRQSPHSIQIGS